MTLGRTVHIRFAELLLEQARSEAHRARLDFLRADLTGGDCDAAARHVQKAQARARALEGDLARMRVH